MAAILRAAGTSMTGAGCRKLSPLYPGIALCMEAHDTVSIFFAQMAVMQCIATQ